MGEGTREGTGSSFDEASSEAPSAPVLEARLSGYDREQVCAAEGGEVRCREAPRAGGRSTSGARSTAAWGAPIRPRPWGGVRSLAVGGLGAGICVCSDAREVFCWGAETGLVGRGAEPERVRGAEPCEHLSAAGLYACSAGPRGLRCWGKPPWTWGSGAGDRPWLPPTPVPIPVAQIDQLATDFTTVCARSGEEVLCHSPGERAGAWFSIPGPPVRTIAARGTSLCTWGSDGAIRCGQRPGLGTGRLPEFPREALAVVAEVEALDELSVSGPEVCWRLGDRLDCLVDRSPYHTNLGPVVRRSRRGVRRVAPPCVWLTSGELECGERETLEE